MPPPRRKTKKPTPERLANVALHYLSRYAASEASLRRVLENRVRRAVMADETFAADAEAQASLAQGIDKIIETHKRTGVLNDQAFAEMKVSSLRRAGRSARRITQQLAQKGVKGEVIEAALEPEEGVDAQEAELKAAQAYARRRGLGPFRKGGPSEDRAIKAKEIASMARAGFSFDTAKKILGAGPEDLEDAF